MEALPPASSLDDDRVVSYSGAALLDGAAAGVLWMKRQRDPHGVLCFDTTRHSLVDHDSKSLSQDLYSEVAPVLATPYQTTTLDVNEKKPWRRHHVIGIRLNAPKHRQELRSILHSLQLLPIIGSIHRAGSHYIDDHHVVDLPSLFATCELGLQLRELERGFRSNEAKRRCTVIAEGARQNPLLTDFLPDHVRRRFYSVWPNDAVEVLRMGAEYWESRLEQQSGSNASEAGRLLIDILAAERSGPGR